MTIEQQFIEELKKEGVTALKSESGTSVVTDGDELDDEIPATYRKALKRLMSRKANKGKYFYQVYTTHELKNGAKYLAQVRAFIYEN
jgi:hypothetical protein